MRKKKNSEETGNTGNRTYGEVTRAGRNPTSNISKTNNADSNHKQNIREKLHSVSPTNWFRKHASTNSKWATNKIWYSTPNYKSITSNSKKRKHSLSDKQRPARKHLLNYSNQISQTSDGNIKKIRRTIQNSTGLQSDPAGNVINSSAKNFKNDVWKL